MEVRKVNAKRNKKKRNKNINNSSYEYKPTREEIKKLNEFIKKIEVKTDEEKSKSQL